MSAFDTSFWWQAGALGVGLLVLHLRSDIKATGRWPGSWRQWRETITSIIVFVALFTAISGGRGCAGSSPGDGPDEAIDAPDPFGRG